MILRFITCGNVDDGKSTLIGRMLYDSRAVSPDILEALERQNRNKSDGAVDLALLTDGLRAEREQGITIDVAYKYFTTPRRKFIIADAPGHVQYTRNMVTGASNADAALILIDARKGVTEQTRRHTAIAALLGIPQLVVCVNKIDLVDFRQDAFEQIVADFRDFARLLEAPEPVFIPLSALAGDNVVQRSERLRWYQGPALLEYLESAPGSAEQSAGDPRFQVQYVIRPGSEDLHDYRGYAGQIQSGTYRKGDPVLVLPAGLSTTIAAIEVHQREVEEARAPQAAVFHLADSVDVSRGTTIVPADRLPTLSQDIEAMICITGSAPIQPGERVLLQHHSATVRAVIQEVEHKLDINKLEKIAAPALLTANDLAAVRLRTSEPLAFDPYWKNRKTGAFILIHENTNQTIAAGIIREPVAAL